MGSALSTGMRTVVVLLLSSLLLLGCGGPPFSTAGIDPTEAGSDTGCCGEDAPSPEAGQDALPGHDAAPEAGQDAADAGDSATCAHCDSGSPETGSEAGIDSGTPAEAGTDSGSNQDSGNPSEAGSEGGGGGDAGDGGIVCNQTVCGGSCVNVQTDPDNCGTCAHGCQGGTCSAGTCQAVTLASGTGSLIAVDATNVYWFNGSFLKVPLFGGASTVFCGGSPRGANALVSDGTNVYWSDQIGGVYTCPVGGCVNPTKLSTSYGDTAATFGGIAVDANNLYWTTDSHVYTCDKQTCNGGNANIFANTGGVDLVIDSTHAYWTTGGAVLSCPLSGCPGNIAGQLVPTAQGASWIAVDGSQVYWTSGTTGVKACNKATCLSPSTLFTGTIGNGVTADGVNAYWIAVPGANYNIDRCAVGGCGGTPTNVASGPGTSINALTSDATSVYWLTQNGTSAVVKIAK